MADKGRVLSFLLGLLLCAGPSAWAQVAVTVASVGPNTYAISLHSTVHASQDAVWKVLTDYHHQTQMVPHLVRSEVIGQVGDQKLVLQEVKVHVLFWTFDIHVTQEVTEHPPSEMDFRAIAGDFKHLEGTWTLSSVSTTPPATQLDCHFVVEYKKHVPPWAVRYGTRHSLVDMVRSLQKRAEQKP